MQQDERDLASDVLGRLRMVVLALTRSPGEPDIPDLLVSQAVSAVGAAGGVLAAVRDGGRLEVLASQGYPRATLARFDPLLVGPELPLTDAVYRGEPVWLSNQQEAARQYPRLVRPGPDGTARPRGRRGPGRQRGRDRLPGTADQPVTAAHPIAAGLAETAAVGTGPVGTGLGETGAARPSVSLPLLIGDRPIGVLGVSFGEPPVLDATDRLFLLSLADICALAISGWARDGDARGGNVRGDLDPEAPHALPLPAALIEQAPLGVAFFDRELRFQLVNEALTEINGVPPEEHIGRHLTQVVPEVGARALPELRRVLETGEPVRDVEVSGQTPARPGVLRTWLQSYYPVRTGTGALLGLGALISEVTEQRLGERRLRALIDALYSFVGLCAPDGTVLEANRVALEAAGLSAADVLGRPLWDTYWWSWDGSVADRLREAFEAGRRGESSRYDVEIRVSGGDLVTIDFQLVPVVEAGRVAALVASGADVTERRRSAEQSAALAAQMASATTTEEVCAIATDHIPGALSATSVTVGLLVKDTEELVLRHDPGLDPGLAERHTRQSVRERLPLTDATRTGRPVYVSHLGDYQRAYPTVAADFTAAGLRAAAALPLRTSTNAIIGALGVAWDHPVAFDPTMRARLTTVAELCGQTLERARLYDAEHALVEGLQRRLLGAIPPIEGIEAHAIYQPADPTVGMGGDFYSGVPIDGNRLALAVGDIVGHGVAAAADMAELRTTLATLLTTGTPVAEVFGRAEAVHHLPEGPASFATAVVAVCDTRHDTLEYLHAGHPPLVLRTPDGRTATLTDGRGPLMGIGATMPAPGRVPFPPGSVLVAYTDGLIERRDESVDVGIGRLVEALSEADGTSAEIAETLLRRCRRRSAAFDDVALVVIRRTRRG